MARRIRRCGVATLAALAGAILVHGASGQTCRPDWVPTDVGPTPGPNSTVLASAVFDDGSGPALYVAGYFSTVSGVQAKGIARWDGAQWSPAGQFTGFVWDLEVFDDGSGPALYAAGNFTQVDNVAASCIARFDGAAWTALGGGLSGPPLDKQGLELCVYDDGTGDALYVGGKFDSAGGVPASNIARWNGSSWSALGLGLVGNYSYCEALVVHDDGSGPKLVAGGSFASAGGAPANHLALWDGAAWAPLGGANNSVWSLASFDDGSGDALFVGGQFTSIGGIAANFVAKWNGSTWSSMGGGMVDAPSSSVYAFVRDFRVYDDGSGPKLFVGGRFTSAGGVLTTNLARWNGGSWSSTGTDDVPYVYTLAVYPFANADALYVGGHVHSNLLVYSGSGWAPLGPGIAGVTTMISFDDGSGPALIAGVGEFAGGVRCNGVARWNGSSWSPMGAGFNGTVYAFEVFDDGSGPALYAGGDFTKSGNVTVNRIAKWNGSAWLPLTLGTNGPVRALAVYDSGSGPELYVGGTFGGVGGLVVTPAIAKWNGTAWSTPGGGASNSTGAAREVDSLEVFDGELVAAGSFTHMGGVLAWGIASWDGSTWSALGTGVDSGTNPYISYVWHLEVYDAGAGAELYVAGNFQYASTNDGSQRWFARWNGSSWSSVPGPNGLPGQIHVRTLETYDDGSGLALFVGTNDTSSFATLRRWDGSWENVGLLDVTPGALNAFAVHDLGNGPNLFLGGVFRGVGGDDNLAQWGGCRGCPALTTYCTAGISTNGCAATLTASGTPSASASSGFVVACSGVEGQRNGLLFYGVTDELGLPWSAGSTSFRCVAPPVQRLPSMVSGGTAGQCDGSYSVDVLAYWATHPGALGAPFSGGDEVWAQVWYRDPSAVSGTNLSDGLYWILCP